MLNVEGKTLPEAYHKALWMLEKEGKVYPCPDYNTTMKEVAMTFYVEDAVAEPFISRLFPAVIMNYSNTPWKSATGSSISWSAPVKMYGNTLTTSVSLISSPGSSKS